MLFICLHICLFEEAPSQAVSYFSHVIAQNEFDLINVDVGNNFLPSHRRARAFIWETLPTGHSSYFFFFFPSVIARNELGLITRGHGGKRIYIFTVTRVWRQSSKYIDVDSHVWQRRSEEARAAERGNANRETAFSFGCQVYRLSSPPPHRNVNHRADFQRERVLRLPRNALKRSVNTLDRFAAWIVSRHSRPPRGYRELGGNF